MTTRADRDRLARLIGRYRLEPPDARLCAALTAARAREASVVEQIRQDIRRDVARWRLRRERAA